jgi:predicted nucleic acid-binding protein
MRAIHSQKTGKVSMEIALKAAKKLTQTGSLTPDELLELETLVTHKITFIREELVAGEWLEKAEDLLHDIDPDDTPFLALALQLGCKLWTGDKKLRVGLLQKGFSDVLNTDEVFDLLQKASDT